MNSNQIQCQQLGGQPVLVARLQPAKSLPQHSRGTVISFGKMECLHLGDPAPRLVGRIGGISPREKE